MLDTSAGALSELVQRERKLVGDVSHQLRSRITALQLRLDELTTHPDPDARREAIAALEQAEKLSGVLDDLLEAARAARAAGAELIGPARGPRRPSSRSGSRTLRAAGRALKVRAARAACSPGSRPRASARPSARCWRTRCATATAP